MMHTAAGTPFPNGRILSRLVFSGVVLLLLQGCQFLGRMQGSQTSVQTTPNPCVVLALPQSGPYASFANKIRHGATEAIKELSAKGTSVRLENIDTEAGDWLARLSALPPMCAVVGGPIQESKYLDARKAGLMAHRAFFAFMPTLQTGEEGRLAWRFFPSQQDQINALIGFATDELGIRTYGAFYPADNYGRRMTQLLESDLGRRHMPLQKASYDPKAPVSWKAAVRPLINPRMSDDGKTILPQTMFEAVFLPDSWKNIDGITQSMVANGEDRLVLLGTTLWEQGLSGKQIPAAERLSLAVFPAVWNKAKAPKSIAQTGDFWTALGYDFMNFAAAMGLAMKPDPAIVTTVAQKASPAIRGMAPIFWDENGKASQRLYLFQITPGGMAPLNKERFIQRRTAIAERAALRMQNWGHIDPDTGEALPQSQTQPATQPAPDLQETPLSAPAASAPSIPAPAPAEASAQPAPAVLQSPSTQQGHMSNVPITTHKLRLPVKK